MSVYLVWSHEHGAWWGPGGHGYVHGIGEAGRYSREAAISICIRAIPGSGHVLGALPELPVPLADVLEMQGAFRRQYPDAKEEGWE